MTFFFAGLFWYGLLFALGFAAHGMTRRVFADPWAAWATARALGLAVPAFIGWYAGVSGLAAWVWVSLGVALGGAVWSLTTPQGNKKAVGELELVGLAVFWLTALERSPVYAVRGTEKPMDLAILAAVLRAQPLPPEDPWFAGFPLPYYYWGFLPWVLPGKISGFPPDTLFNLLTPTVASLTAQLIYGWVRAGGASWQWAVAAAVTSVFLGTTAGWSQLLGGAAGVFTTDLWAASRGIAHAITEFPLFTFLLGDLHPHLLCQPWVALALLIWEQANGQRRVEKLFLRALSFGVAVASNPWITPALALCLGTMALVTSEKKRVAVKETLTAVAVAFTLFLPAGKSLPAGVSGVGFVHTPTTWGETCNVLLPALVPVLVAAVFLVKRAAGAPGLALAAVALGLLPWVTARPLLALAVVLFAVLVVCGPRTLPMGVPGALVAACLVVLAGMELFFVQDPYGPDWYRMNTVFKTLSFVFLVLPASSLRLLSGLPSMSRKAMVLGAALPWLLSLPQLTTVVYAAWPFPESFAGLGWMAPGEVEAARFLHNLKGKVVLVEAVGEAYSDGGRISSASGVPTVIGWENHERLWRGSPFAPLITERKNAVAALYLCPDAGCVHRWARQLQANILVLGPLERRLYPGLNEQVLERAGSVVFRLSEVTLVRLKPHEARP